MKSVCSKQEKKIAISTNFTENRFSADYVIDAYLKGHNDGSGLNLSQIITESLQKLKDSIDIVNKFYEENLTEDICISLFLKTSFPDKIYYLFAISEDAYFDSKIRKQLYDSSSNSMKNNPFIYMSFMPCKSKSCINKNSIKADNYIEIE